MNDRIFADVERALRAARADEADSLLRELELWRASIGQWHIQRFVPGGPLSAPISPGPCIEAVVDAVRAAFPDRASAIIGAIGRALWPVGIRPNGGRHVHRQAQERIVADADAHPSLVVLAPPDAAREAWRLVLERPVEEVALRLYQPIDVPFFFEIGEASVEIDRSIGRGTINGEPFERRSLVEGDVIRTVSSYSLLFLDRT